MINAIIFSKDRACQLHLFLDSLFACAYNIIDNISVIYTASSENFAKGYTKLQSYMPIVFDNIKWIQEQSLYGDTTKSVEDYAKQPNGLITFFTDDSVFYRHIHEYKFPIESCLNPTGDIGCFSLRLGVNTTEQMYWQSGHSIKLKYTQVNNLIKWKHANYPFEHGYGYPLSLDGHIFRGSQICNLIKKVGKFDTVNDLEGRLAKYKFEIAPCMASFEQSALVVVPINRVQNKFQNVAGMFYGISAEELNRRYLLGEIIDYHAIDFSTINGTHQELEYKFRRLL